MSDRRPSSYARRLGQVAGKARPDTGLEPAPPAPEEPAPIPPPPVVDRPQPIRRGRRRAGERVRITVDLERDTHRALRLFAVEADADASEVVRLLIDRLLRDPGFAEQIRTELDEDRGS
jgi:hypothetical protein